MKNGRNLDENNWRRSFAEFVSCGGSPLCQTFQPGIVMAMMMILKAGLGPVMMIVMLLMLIVTRIRSNDLHCSCSGAKRSPFSTQLSAAGPVKLVGGKILSVE